MYRFYYLNISIMMLGITLSIHNNNNCYIYVLKRTIFTEVLHPSTTLQEWYHFVQENDTNQNRGVPIDLLEMHYAIWAIY